MKHYQKIAIATTFVLTAAGAYLGSQGMIVPDENDFSGAAIGGGIGLVSGLLFYGLLKIGIQSVGKCVDWCDSARSEVFNKLVEENKQLKSACLTTKMANTEQYRFMQCSKHQRTHGAINSDYSVEIFPDEDEDDEISYSSYGQLKTVSL